MRGNDAELRRRRITLLALLEDPMSGIEVGLIASAALGAGTQVAGNVMAANAKADATARSGALKRQQADELMSRQVINERIMRERAEISAGTYAGASGLGESGG